MRKCGFDLDQVEERTIPLDDLLEADEVFCTGTAVVLIPVNSVTYHDKRCNTSIFFFSSYSLHFIKIDCKYFVSNLCIYVTVKLFKCRIEYKPKAEAVYLKLHSILTGIQTGRIEDEKGWTVLVD